MRILIALCLMLSSLSAIAAPASGTVEIKSSSGKCLDVDSGSTKDFARIQFYECNGTPAQRFKIVDYPGGYFSIANVKSGKCLDAKGGSSAAGIPFVQYTCSGSIGHNQQFKSGSKKNFVVRHSGLCLNAEGGGKVNRSNLLQIRCNGGGNQRFAIKSIKSGGTNPPPSNNGWKLVWKDEFTGKGDIDRSKWNYEVWKPGTVNNELQNYTNNRRENVRVGNGVLTIEARRDGFGGEFSSGRIKSQGKASWTYGRFEARIKLPGGGKGSWPAFWMMPDNQSRGWPSCGEIDIMENVSYDPGTLVGTIHTGAYNHVKGTQKEGRTSINHHEWNTYSIEWDSSKIVWKVNGREYHRFTKHGGDDQWPFNKPFHIILNLAIGGAWGGAMGVDKDFPRQMQVDYVRVYKKG